MEQGGDVIVKACAICAKEVVVTVPSRYERTKTCSAACRQRYAALGQGRYQHELARRRRDKGIVQPDEYKLVSLTKDAFTFVSNEDYLAASAKHWCLSDTGYAKRTRKGSNERLHRMIMERVIQRTLLDTEQVDHINGHRLDNRRDNLRVVDNQSNAYNRGKQRNNTNGFKGIFRDNSVGESYGFEVTASGVRTRWSGYPSKHEAAWMYDQFASQLHGEFARLNFNYQ